MPVQQPGQERGFSDAHTRAVQRYKMKKFEGPKTVLTSGVEIDATPYMNVQPPGTIHDGKIIASIREFLIKPKPECGYFWRLREDDSTQGWVEDGSLRPVRMNEIKKGPATRVVRPYVMVENGQNVAFARWKKFALYEADPETTYQWLDQPGDYDIARRARRSEQINQDLIEATGGRVSGGLERMGENQRVRRGERFKDTFQSD